MKLRHRLWIILNRTQTPLERHIAHTQRDAPSLLSARPLSVQLRLVFIVQRRTVSPDQSTTYHLYTFHQRQAHRLVAAQRHHAGWRIGCGLQQGENSLHAHSAGLREQIINGDVAESTLHVGQKFITVIITGNWTTTCAKKVAAKVLK